MINIGTEVYLPIDISYREMYSAYRALDEELTKGLGSPAQLLTLDIEKLQDSVPDVIAFSTTQFWGLWKIMTRNEVVWDLTRSQAFRLRAALHYRLAKRHKGSLKITERWFHTAQMFY